jgi:hypothetical protein
MDKNFIDNGFTEYIQIDNKYDLRKIQKLIYSITKPYLINHEKNISLKEKLNLEFKEIPSQIEWSSIMKKVNNSTELKSFINSDEIKNAFKIIFNNPTPFPISTFRARFPNQHRVVYNWHQDEGTWFLSNNKIHINKFPATLWFSINGANKEDSIEIIKYSHLQKLYYHTYVEGQGYFKIKNKFKIDKMNINKIKIEPSNGFIFHPLLIHRSAPNNVISMRPRYTIDIRYYDENYRQNYKIDLRFKIARIINWNR